MTRVALGAGPVFENIERPGGRRQRCLSTSDPIRLTDLPRAWTSGFDALVIAPVAGELDDSWALLGGPGPATAGGAGTSPLVALGWQGLLRRLEAGADVERIAPSPSALVRLARLVVVSHDDLVPGLEIGGLLSMLGPATTLVVTAAEARRPGHRGPRAPEMARRGIRGSTYPAIPSDGIVDPTGAGDVFLADDGRQGCSAPELGDPVLLAAAAASLAHRGPGPPWRSGPRSRSACA